MKTFIDPLRLTRLKIGYTARNVDTEQPLKIINRLRLRPRNGDLAVATVTRVGHHRHIMTGEGRAATLYIGDELLLPYGARYAPDEYEAEVPEDMGPCSLVAQGGIMGYVRNGHSLVSQPTQLQPIGLLADSSGRVINLADLALPEPAAPVRRPPTFIVLGTAMNSGKTTTAACLAKGLTRAGLRVGAAKATGTGNSGDPWMYRDAGAVEVLDFVDAGLAGTFQVPIDRLAQCVTFLHSHLVAREVDAVVLEIADGLLHKETAQLLTHPLIHQLADATLFAAVDSSGAVWGVQRLRDLGYKVVAVSGPLTGSPLAAQEAQSELDVPVYRPADLADAVVASGILQRTLAASPSLVMSMPPEPSLRSVIAA